jgi:tRNA threonylcarbamoyladenosine biosynthesis protein TsaB
VTVLALDTTTRAGSAAIVNRSGVLAELSGDARLTHGERLPGELMRVLAAAGMELGRIELLAVAAGPGSFTGLRVGIAAMQGLAMAAALRIVPVSALEALAVAAGPGPELIGTWMDAQRGQVFGALFDPAGQRVLLDPSALTPLETLQSWSNTLGNRPIRFIGDGAVRYADVLDRELGPQGIVLPPPPPLAGIIGSIASANPDRAVLPHAVIPIYIRRPDAELGRTRIRTQDKGGSG